MASTWPSRGCGMLHPLGSVQFGHGCAVCWPRPRCQTRRPGKCRAGISSVCPSSAGRSRTTERFRRHRLGLPPRAQLSRGQICPHALPGEWMLSPMCGAVPPPSVVHGERTMEGRQHGQGDPDAGRRRVQRGLRLQHPADAGQGRPDQGPRLLQPRQHPAEQPRQPDPLGLRVRPAGRAHLGPAQLPPAEHRPDARLVPALHSITRPPAPAGTPSGTCAPAPRRTGHRSGPRERPDPGHR
jgi:hypothetical protein